MRWFLPETFAEVIASIFEHLSFLDINVEISMLLTHLKFNFA